MGEEMNILRSEELEKVTGGASGKDWAHDKSALKQHTVVGLAPEKSCICMKKPEKTDVCKVSQRGQYPDSGKKK